MDIVDMTNYVTYRPVSNISFQSKTIERVFGPLHFLIYLVDLFVIVTRHRARYLVHFYIDDGDDDRQMYFIYITRLLFELKTLIHGLSFDVEAWMRASRPLLNPQKTHAQLIWLGSQQLDKLRIDDVPVLSTTLHSQFAVRNLGVILHSQLTLSNHVTNV